MKLFSNDMKVSRGEVHIIKDLCKGCGFCVTYCPMGVLEVSEDFNVKGYHYAAIKDQESCINCGLCQSICPDFAIWSTLRERKEVSAILI
jgi:2-oxoglutarate ferredoxin oxidoreductase subunit delta